MSVFKIGRTGSFIMTIIMDYGHKNLESPRIGLKSKNWDVLIDN